MSDPILNDAARVIEAFGGIRPMAKKLGVAVTTVQGWKERNAIPVQRLDQIRDAAKRENIDLGPTSGAASSAGGASAATAKPGASASAPGTSSPSASAASASSGASSSRDGAARSSASTAGSAPSSGSAGAGKAERVPAEKVSTVSAGIKRSADGDGGKTVDGSRTSPASSSASSASQTTANQGSASRRSASQSPPAKKSSGRAFAFGLGFAVVLLIGAAAGWYFKDAILGTGGDGATVAALEKRVAAAEKAAAEAKTAAQAATAASSKLADQVKAAGANAGDNAGNKAAIAKLTADLSALRAELATVKKAAEGSAGAGATASTAKLAGDVTKLQAAVAALQKAVAGGAKTGTGGDATGSAGAGAPTKAALDKLAADLAALNGKIAALSKQGSQSDQAAKDIAALNGKMAAMEARLKSAEANSGGGKASLIVALSQLRAAAASGQPFAASLKVAGGLAGAESQATPVLKSLESAAAKGAPTVPVLRSRFNALSSDLVAAAMRSQGAGWAGRAWNKLKSTVIVRRTGRDVKGASPDALAAQAEVRLDDGDLPGAVALVRKMPPAAQKAAAGWLADAERRIAIDAAVKKLDALMPALSAGQK